MKDSDLKHEIVLVHDSFTQMGGAERVFKSFVEMFPNAPIYTLVSTKEITDKLGIAITGNSFLQKMYLKHPVFKHYLLLLPFAINFLKLPKAKVILTSSSLFLKAINKPKGAVQINYCHTPARFLWTDPEYIKQEVPLFVQPFLKFFLYILKNWDVWSSVNVDQFIANSFEVQTRIHNFYGRRSKVIYPFVDINFWKPTIAKGNYFLMGGRLQAHKRYEVILDAIRETNIMLKVVGDGRFVDDLKSKAGENVVFVGKVSDDELRDLYSGAKGFIFPPVEDAGIMPLEAAACGTATLGISKGGSLETIVDGSTGEFFSDYKEEEIRNILLKWDEGKYKSEVLLAHASKFSKERFEKEIMEVVEGYLK